MRPSPSPSPSEFTHLMLTHGLSSKHAKELLKISRALADLDRAEATYELPFDPPLPDAGPGRAAARRVLAGKIKMVMKEAGTGWRAATVAESFANTPVEPDRLRGGFSVAWPGGLEYIPVP